MLSKTVFVTLLALCSGVEFQIQNTANFDIWVGIQANPNHPLLRNGGFDLPPGQKVSSYLNLFLGVKFGLGFCTSARKLGRPLLGSHRLQPKHQTLRHRRLWQQTRVQRGWRCTPCHSGGNHPQRRPRQRLLRRFLSRRF